MTGWSAGLGWIGGDGLREDIQSSLESERARTGTEWREG